VFTDSLLNQVLQAIQSPPHTASPPFVQQLTLSVEPQPEVLRLCEWKDGDEPVCGKPITHESTPGHLSEHGIRDMSRDEPTTCLWVGCKRKKPMNRESITRHVRYVHVGERRRIN